MGVQEKKSFESLRFIPRQTVMWGPNVTQTTIIVLDFTTNRCQGQGGTRGKFRLSSNSHHKCQNLIGNPFNCSAVFALYWRGGWTPWLAERKRPERLKPFYSLLFADVRINGCPSSCVATDGNLSVADPPYCPLWAGICSSPPRPRVNLNMSVNSC